MKKDSTRSVLGLISPPWFVRPADQSKALLKYPKAAKNQDQPDDS